MERESLTTGLRARAAHLMSWLTGPVQNQQRQQQENDRQTRDGITHGEEDPDNRARQATLSATQQTHTPQGQGQEGLYYDMRGPQYDHWKQGGASRSQVERAIQHALQRAGETGPIEVLTPYADTAFRAQGALQSHASMPSTEQTEAGPPQAQTAPRYGQVGYDGADDVRIPRELGPVSGPSAAEISVASERAQERAEREDTAAPTQERLARLKASLADLQDRVVALRAQAPDQSRPQERARGRGQGMAY